MLTVAFVPVAVINWHSSAVLIAAGQVWAGLLFDPFRKQSVTHGLQQPEHIAMEAQRFARLTIPGLYVLWIYELMKQVCADIPRPLSSVP